MCCKGFTLNVYETLAVTVQDTELELRDPAGSAGIHDVARLAGVSIATVSRVLNMRRSVVAISPATTERVRAAAATLRYRPNASARSLRTTKTQTIGVIMQDLLHPFAADFLRVIYDACRTRGYYVLVGHAERREHAGEALGDMLGPDRVDGLLLIGDVLWTAGDDAGMRTVLQLHRHVVSVGCRPGAATGLSLAVDNATGVEMALQYLVDLGHRAIAYIGGCEEANGFRSWESQQRQDAYCRFMHAHDLPSIAVWETGPLGDLAGVQERLRQPLTSPDRPTAALADDDWTAIMALKTALLCGMRVPDDFSLIGFDDIAFSAVSTPALTTVHQPLDAMGRYAAAALLDCIGGIEMPGPAQTAESRVIFPPTLVCRESCAPPSMPVCHGRDA
jgi:LacI family transcriptional regulator